MQGRQKRGGGPATPNPHLIQELKQNFLKGIGLLQHCFIFQSVLSCDWLKDDKILSSAMELHRAVQDYLYSTFPPGFSDLPTALLCKT